MRSVARCPSRPAASASLARSPRESPPKARACHTSHMCSRDHLARRSIPTPFLDARPPSSGSCGSGGGVSAPVRADVFDQLHLRLSRCGDARGLHAHRPRQPASLPCPRCLRRAGGAWSRNHRCPSLACGRLPPPRPPPALRQAATAGTPTLMRRASTRVAITPIGSRNAMPAGYRATLLMMRPCTTRLGCDALPNLMARWMLVHAGRLTQSLLEACDSSHPQQSHRCRRSRSRCRRRAYTSRRETRATSYTRNTVRRPRRTSNGRGQYAPALIGTCGCVSPWVAQADHRAV